MNKRQKKKLVNKHGYKSFYKRAAKCKNFSDWLHLIYPTHILKKVIKQANNFYDKLFIKECSNLFYQPVILGLEPGITFNQENKDA